MLFSFLLGHFLASDRKKTCSGELRKLLGEELADAKRNGKAWFPQTEVTLVPVTFKITV